MILDRYLLRQFFPIFFIAAFMFVLLLSLIDLFANLWRYLAYEVPPGEILLVCLYYLPKSFSYALPISLLFAAAYTLGDLYGRNELNSVFSSGIPFRRFSLPLLVIGFGSSLFSFFFEDRLVIPAYRTKTELGRRLLHQEGRQANSDVVIKADNGRIIYAVDYYDDRGDSLNGVNIIEQTGGGEFLSLIRALGASWNGEYWELTDPVMYRWEGGLLRPGTPERTDTFREKPDSFKRNAVEVEFLSARDAALLAGDLKAAGLPHTGALANYHHRFSFSAVPLVVMILSLPMGGWFRKNTLLMSLLSSLASAVVFYVTDMISMMMAMLGYIPPFLGAWFPVLVFIGAGAFLLRSART
jgi:lipopolysaccharide export system permease protein